MKDSSAEIEEELFQNLNVQKANPSTKYKINGKIDANYYVGVFSQN